MSARNVIIVDDLEHFHDLGALLRWEAVLKARNERDAAERELAGVVAFKDAVVELRQRFTYKEVADLAASIEYGRFRSARDRVDRARNQLRRAEQEWTAGKPGGGA